MKSRTKSVRPRAKGAEQVEVQLSLPMAEVLHDVRHAFFGLCVHTGQRVLAAMMEADRQALCGPKGTPQPQRAAYRGGHTNSTVVLGGQRVTVKRPRARGVDVGELQLPSFEWASASDPLNAATLHAIAAGVSTRRYGTTIDEVPRDEQSTSTSKSAVSRRFVALSSEQMNEWLARRIDDLQLPVVMIDGIHFGDRVILVALGIDTKGRKHVLGLREGSTEKTAVVKALLSDLIERGLDADQARLWVIDGGKALRRAITQTFGTTALVQRCQEHKRRNVLEHLPDDMHASVSRVLRDAWGSENAKLAKRQLERLASSLQARHPGAAASVREGLDETLTLQGLGVTGALYRTLRTTNPIENLNGSIARYTRNVKRWRDGEMVQRWVASALSDACTRFRALRGHRDIGKLIAALQARIAPAERDQRKAA
jgi:transposase-like protein